MQCSKWHRGRTGGNEGEDDDGQSITIPDETAVILVMTHMLELLFSLGVVGLLITVSRCLS